MISHIRQAIDDVDSEDTGPSAAPGKDPVTAYKHTSGHDSGGDEEGTPCQMLKRMRLKFAMTTAAASRPRRRKANYGITKVGGIH